MWNNFGLANLRITLKFTDIFKFEITWVFIGNVIITLSLLTRLIIRQRVIDHGIIDFVRQCTTLKKLEYSDKNLVRSTRQLLPDVVVK